MKEDMTADSWLVSSTAVSSSISKQGLVSCGVCKGRLQKKLNAGMADSFTSLTPVKQVDCLVHCQNIEEFNEKARWLLSELSSNFSQEWCAAICREDLVKAAVMSAQQNVPQFIQLMRLWVKCGMLNVHWDFLKLSQTLLKKLCTTQEQLEHCQKCLASAFMTLTLRRFVP